MNYINLRINDQLVHDHQLVEAFVLQGQRSDTLNWESIMRCSDYSVVEQEGRKLLQDLDEGASLYHNGYGIFTNRSIDALQIAHSWFTDCNEHDGTDREVVVWALEQYVFIINDDECAQDERSDAIDMINRLVIMLNTL